MKDKILKDKKNLLIIVGIIAAIIIIIIILTLFVFKKDKGMTTDTLENKLETVGKNFYEQHYYPSLEEAKRKQQLAAFKDNGIKIDITNLELLVPLEKEVKQQLEEDKCDFDKTKVVIYPKDPYGLKDYTLKLELSCEE